MVEYQFASIADILAEAVADAAVALERAGNSIRNAMNCLPMFHDVAAYAGRQEFEHRYALQRTRKQRRVRQGR